ncbi:CoA ester lyase [Pseudarthrobacter sp. AG30]|uniref:HpcH/HpaI aldolase/citrate lyase family protein n=1 Tax=Pseudarthrobacter sp. AG30 TaxID=2249742 RepID=UPI000D6E9E34|nr:CoA ester lyase [Pseudarthrobacter sp. AG30]RAX15118.1 CoA ester lyase [Pseudarthrobacter sp. AG30]
MSTPANNKQNRRRRRSELATPASNEWMFSSAIRSDADMVFLDLEDATAEDQKESARHKVVNGLNTLDWRGKVRAVRINHMDTQHAKRDLEVVVGEAGASLDVIVVPKVRSAQEIVELDRELSILEKASGLAPIELEVLIETPQAVLDVANIATAAPRVGALVLGGGDLSAEVGARYGSGFMPYDDTLDVWHSVRWSILLAARAAGILAIDTPFPTYGDGNERFRRQALQAFHMGFDGKWAIHPSQVDVANETFTPSEDDLRIAAEVLSTYDEALSTGLGATKYAGTLLDIGNVNSARHMLAAAGATTPAGKGAGV